MIGRVYKIQHLDSSLCYIGSTCNTIRDRWQGHKKSFRKWIGGNNRFCVALYPFLEQYGVDRFQMLLIREYEIADKNQLRAYEQLAINRTKQCCNKNAALQLVSMNSMALHYSQANKEEIYKMRKEYYQANKRLIKNRSNEYYQANKDALKQKATTKVMCECGTECRKGYLSDHRKTAKHARLLGALSAPTTNVNRVLCECGTESSKANIAAHRKSAKHARLLAALSAPTQ